MANVAEIQIHPQYLLDEAGQRSSVLLSIEDYEALMEVIEDLNDAAALDHAVANSKGLLDLDDVIADMKRDSNC